MKRPQPDNRLDWRDPQMPVFRNKRDGTTIRLAPEREQARAMYSFYMAMLHPDDCPSWQDDPTYNLRRKK